MNFPFNDHPNTVVLTCCHIIDGSANIFYVSHDADDGMWQFLCGKSHSENEARVVSLYEIYALDPTIAQIADLPYGYIAKRESIESNWNVRKN
ncbi:MAG: hypothetical protein IJW62_01740 [Clostridia bacterium]|nr:hypothetical protein [Clostridia bacterium]